jgi:hypothetical protein
VLVRDGDSIMDLTLLPGQRLGIRLAPFAGAMVGLLSLNLWPPSTAFATLITIAVMGIAGAIAGWAYTPLLKYLRLLGRRSRRVRGTVELAGGPVSAPTVYQPAVLVRTLFCEANDDGRAQRHAVEEVRGVPFLLRLPDGRAARLDPTQIRLVETPRRIYLPDEALKALGAAWRGHLGRTILQTSIHPGDQLEVSGRLETEVDQTGNAAPSRGVPLVTYLRPHTGRVIWARRLQRLS